MENQKPDINIGDVFYYVELDKTVTYRSGCRVCEGTEKLTINGVTFKCPMCKEEERALTVRGYKVVRYRVFSITEEMNNSDWKVSPLRSFKYGLYHKHGRGNSYFNHKTKTVYSHYLKSPWLNSESVDSFNSDFVYSDYKLAVECANRLTQMSIEEVAEYNKEHGTNFELPVFDIVHDKKSN